MKPLIRKTLLVALLLGACSIRSLGQSCDGPRSSALIGYLEYKGGGWEFGGWPNESPLGFFGGMALQKRTIPSSAKHPAQELISSQIYGKLQLRLHERLVALTATVGMIDAEELLLAAGLRFYVPVSDKFVILAEPQLGNRGFNLQMGLARRF